MSDIISALNSNGSGIDFIQLGRDLANATITPRQNIVEDRIEEIDVSVSALGEAKSLLGEMESALRVISRDPLMTTTSSSSAITATVTDPSQVEPGSESIDVIATAVEQVLQFTGFSSEDAVVQGGTITVEFGIWSAEEPSTFTDAGARPSFDMVVPEGGTLRDLRDQFETISGVTASIIDVGDGTFTLGVLSDTGTQNGMRFSVNATGAAADVDLTEFDITTDIADHQLRAASDAVLTYNGIQVFRDSNEINDLVPGVTLELNSATTSAETLTTQIEYEEALARVQVLTDQLNTTLQYLDEQTSRGALEGSEPGALAGESSIELLKNNIRSMIRTPIEGFNDTSYYLSDFGIEMRLDGTVELNEDKFESLMADTPNAVMALFESQTTTNNPNVSVAGAPPSTTNSSSYTFTRDPVSGDAILGSSAMQELFPGVGVSFFLAANGPMSGTSYTVPDGVDTFEVSFGRSFADTLLARVGAAISGEGSISSRESDLNTRRTEEEEELEDLQTELETLEARYNERFTAMESTITALNNTGSYIENLISAWEAEAG